MEERSVDQPAAKDDSPSAFDIVQDQGKGKGAVHHHASSSGIAFPNPRSLSDSDFSSKATVDTPENTVRPADESHPLESEGKSKTLIQALDSLPIWNLFSGL